MFKSDLKDIQISMNISHNNLKQYNSLNNNTSDIDLMYQLYSKYMKMSKQQITLQQILIMKDSQTLIQSLALSNKINLNKDTSSTIDSFSIDQDLDYSIIDGFSTIQRRSSKKITRKQGRISKILASNDNAYDQTQQIIKDIQLNCSQKTYQKVKNILNQHRRANTQILQIQNKQKKLNRIQQNSDKLQQQNLLLKAQLQQVLNKLKLKDQQFKDKLSQLKIQKKQNIIPINNPKQIQQINFNKNYTQKQLISYINQKQQICSKRYKKIQQIQKNIGRKLQETIMSINIVNQNNKYSQMNQNNKYCQMINHIKQSVLEYRQYLELQGLQYDKLFTILKKQMERNTNQLTQHKLQINY